MIKIGSKVKWKDPYWSDMQIIGEVLEDYGNMVVIQDSQAETNDDRLEFKKSELEEVA